MLALIHLAMEKTWRWRRHFKPENLNSSGLWFFCPSRILTDSLPLHTLVNWGGNPSTVLIELSSASVSGCMCMCMAMVGVAAYEPRLTSFIYASTSIHLPPGQCFPPKQRCIEIKTILSARLKATKGSCFRFWRQRSFNISLFYWNFTLPSPSIL